MWRALPPPLPGVACGPKTGKGVRSLGLFAHWTVVHTSMSHRGDGGRCPIGATAAGVLATRPPAPVPVVVEFAVAVPPARGGGGCGASSSFDSGSYPSHPSIGSSSRSSSSGSSWRLGCADICPKYRGDLRLPTSAKWSAREFPGISMCEEVCSHFTCSPSRSVVVSICSHRSLCYVGPFVLVQLIELRGAAWP